MTTADTLKRLALTAARDALGVGGTAIDGADDARMESALEKVIHARDGEVARMYHERDDSETVEIEDICGDIQSLVGSPLVEAYVSESSTLADHFHDPDIAEWTFYHLRTATSDPVTIRWCGYSNGYYSTKITIDTYGTT